MVTEYSRVFRGAKISPPEDIFVDFLAFSLLTGRSVDSRELFLFKVLMPIEMVMGLRTGDIILQTITGGEKKNLLLS